MSERKCIKIMNNIHIVLNMRGLVNFLKIKGNNIICLMGSRELFF